MYIQIEYSQTIIFRLLYKNTIVFWKNYSLSIDYKEYILNDNKLVFMFILFIKHILVS